MDTHRKNIVRLMHTFVFKWRKYFGQQVTQKQCVNWESFININSKYFDALISSACSNTQYDVICVTTVHPLRDVCLPDTELCRQMCYPNDTLVRVCTCANVHIVISADGSMIQKDSSKIEMVKYGSMRYAICLIQMIQQLNCSSKDEWLKILNELDKLQHEIEMFCEIKQQIDDDIVMDRL